LASKSTKTTGRSRTAKVKARPKVGADARTAGRGKRSLPVSGQHDKVSAKQKRRPARSKSSPSPRSTGSVQALGTGGAGPGGGPPNARKLRETAASLEAAKAAIDAALDKKALLPVLIDVSSLASYTDFIAIVSGRSDRQVDAISDGIHTAMKARGRSLLGQEGTGSGRWTLLDYGDVVIHVFYHPVREFYDLESLWVDAPRVPLRIPPEAVMAQPDALYGNL
jgi:ribosome-associated protein